MHDIYNSYTPLHILCKPEGGSGHETMVWGVGDGVVERCGVNYETSMWDWRRNYTCSVVQKIPTITPGLQSLFVHDNIPSRYDTLFPYNTLDIIHKLELYRAHTPRAACVERPDDPYP